jgi:Ca-activated chloride channel homolog
MSGDFLAPERLWLLLVVAGLAVAHLVAQRWRRGAQVRFTQIDLLDHVAPRRPRWRRHVVAAIQLVALTLAVVASARPVERSTERTRSEGRILVLHDVSLSMMATDVEPDRFTAAQEAALDFVDQVELSVEVGLVSFSGSVNVEVPPTLDRNRIARGIENLELAEATAIGDALASATRLLVQLADDLTADGDAAGADQLDADRVPGVIVLLTDGETTVGQPTLEGAERAAEVGIPVFTIAFGTPDGAILDPGGSGQLIPVPVRPEEMQAVAELTGGAAFEAATEAELTQAYDQIRGSLGETLGDEIEIVTELTWRWALASFVTMSLAWILGLWWLRGMV